MSRLLTLGEPKMKARGRYILGIDFDQRAPRVLAIPMRGHSPLWNQAEAVEPDAFETLVDEIPAQSERETTWNKYGMRRRPGGSPGSPPGVSSHRAN